MELRLYRNQNPTITIPIDERTIYTDEVMERHFIQCSFVSATILDIKVDDYIIFRNDRYNINVEFQHQKLSNFEYEYTILFEHVSYWLKERIFMHLGDIEFSFYGSPSDFVQLIVDCMNEEDTGWAGGNVDALEHKLISFYGEEKGYTCKGALMKIAEEFGLEFWFTGKTIHLTKEAGVQTNLDFEYGRGKGLYSITRGALDTPLYNRIYGFGSTKNIPYGYRNGAKRLTFDGRKLERPLAPGERRRETSVIFDDIFPKRTGTLTTVSPDWLELTDTSIDFDLNGQKIEGETPKIVFQTGELGGKEFEITGYNHTTKTISIELLVESDGYTTPNATFSPNIGDKYVFVGIEMPQTFVDAAEAQVKAETQKVFNQLARPPYQVEIDEKYLRDNGVLLNAGDRVRLRDAAMDIDDMIRVTAVSFPLVNENQVTAVISDKILYTNEVQQVIETDKIKETVKVVDRTKAELARRNMLKTRRLQELTFDPDGYFNGEKIKPLSIETYMLSVGAKSQNFGLNGVSINANTEGDPNHLSISHGSLVHYEIEIEGLGYVWQMDSAEFLMLDPDKVYYLSARVRTTALSGTWHLSETPMETESETGYWHFNLGILYPETDGSRGFDLTKGMTFIVGDRITTGRIQSLDGLNFFDLSQGTFKLGDAVSGLDWGVTTPGVLTINGFAIAKVVQVGSDGIINARISGLTDDGPESVRFAAGVNDEFSVLDNGYLKTTKGRIGNWDISTGGLVNDNGMAYIIARQMLAGGREATAMIGANVLNATLGLRAVGLFRNTEDNPFSPNYGMIIDVANGRSNIGILSNAPILNQGYAGGYNRFVFTPTLTNNAINPAHGKMVTVFIETASINTVFLPPDEYITNMLGISPTAFYCIEMTINNQWNSVADLILSADTGNGWIIKGTASLGGVVIDYTFLTVEKGKSVQVTINKGVGNKWIQVINRS